MNISVALTTYNGQKYIEKQLYSILKQDLPVDEVIISDDGSSDSTVEIVEDFINIHDLNNWKIYVNQTNVGYAHNFIQTIMKTTGDIIFLCDQDDIWLPDKTKQITQIFDRNPDLWMVHTEIDLIDEFDSVISSNYDHLKSGYNNYVFDSYARRLNYCGMSSAFRKELRQSLCEFDLHAIPTHDWILGAIACIKGTFATDSIVVTQRRKHSNNAELTDQTKKASREERIQYILLYNRFYDSLRTVLLSSTSDYKVELEWLQKRIDLNNYRIDCLKNKKLLSFLKMFWQIALFPTPKSFFSEMRYYLKN